ncbi:MAG: mechanosensitive ion channel family protein [Thermoleophilia bacterium]
MLDSVILGQVTAGEALTALGFVLGGLVLGFVVRRVVLGRLDRAACRLEWHWCRVLITALGGMPQIWLALAGAYFGIVSLPLEPGVSRGARSAVVVVVILTVTWAASRLAANLIRAYTQEEEAIIPAASIFTHLSAALVAAIGGLIALQYLGISITPILTALGVGGLAVALALQDTLSNLFAGFHLIASKQVRNGDYIQLESGEEGNVIDITWRNTTIRTLGNNTVVIPNSRLAGANFTNYHLPEPEMSVLVGVGIAYDSDLEHVERVALEVARETLSEVTGAEPHFEPLVRFHTFNDSSIDLNVILRAKEFVDSYLIKHDFMKRLKQRFDQEGIEIPFPIRTVNFKDGPPAAGDVLH